MRGAASAIRRMAARPAQWSTRPDPSPETPREETAMEIDDARLLLEFGAVYAWTPERLRWGGGVGHVKIKFDRCRWYYRRLSFGACDREGRRRFVARKTKEATLVANVKQYAMMRAMQHEEYQELHEAIEYMNERQGKLMSTMERRQMLMGEVPELRDKLSEETRVYDRISAEEWNCWRRSRRWMSSWRKGGEPKWRGGETQLLLRMGLPRRQQLCLEAPKRRVTSSCPGSSCKELAETQDYVSEPLRLNHPDQNMEAVNEKNMEALSVVPSAVSEPRWALHMCEKKCRAKGYKFFENLAKRDRRRRSAPQWKASKARRSRGKRFVEGAGRAEVFPRQVVGSVWSGPVLPNMWE